jgi:hypothetical protein
LQEGRKSAKTYAASAVIRGIPVIFNATRPFSITDSHLIGKPVVASDNPAVTGAFLFLQGVSFISPDVPILNAPPGFHVDPPINVDKPPQ